MHTPGHTPGSQCFVVDGRLVAGDTLFLEGCGRTDLPGSDPDAMYESLTQRLATLPDSTVLYPGHRYSRRAVGDHGRHPRAQLRVPHPDPRAVARPHGLTPSAPLRADGAAAPNGSRHELVAGGDEREQHEADGRRREVARTRTRGDQRSRIWPTPTNGGKHSLA